MTATMHPVDFELRPIQPSDGPGIDALYRSGASTTSMSMTTHFQHDAYATLVAEHPGLFGVVATVADVDGLVGVATAFIEDVQLGGRTMPGAYLQNLKVRHDVRRHGLGSRLAAWRIAEARRRFDGDGAIFAGVEATNAASLATARGWATHLLGPLKIVVARTGGRQPVLDGLQVREPRDDELGAVADATNRFYEGWNLARPMTPDRLRQLLVPMDPAGQVRTYRVAVTPDGSIVAGALVVQRFRLMTEHIERIPGPLAILARVLPLVPRDGILRNLEVGFPWHADGAAAAGRHLWKSIQWEWRDEANFVGGVIDQRTPLAEMCRTGPSLTPKLHLMVPVQSPVPLDETRPVVMWR